jgi:hypothetical protein
MTFDERVQALGYLGFTPRQTRFLVTVALHGGFCLRRQYATYAGIEYGKNVRHFLDELVKRGLGRRLQWESNRGHVYHLTARAVYRALGQDDNRNRRVTAPALIARKLMLLDFVLGQSADEWAATEQDKVALCHGRLTVPLSQLPRRVYAGRDTGLEPSARYFIDKLPLFLLGDPPTVHIVYLATGPGVDPFVRFLCDHRGLLTRLAQWAIVLVYPAHTVDVRALSTAFHEFRSGSRNPKVIDSRDDVRWYFQTRLAVEQDNVPAVSSQLIQRFQSARRRFAGAAFETLYAEWTAHGDEVFDAFASHRPAPLDAAGRFLTCELPFSYTQFGKLPGVA